MEMAGATAWCHDRKHPMNRECDQRMGELYDVSVTASATRKQQLSLFLALNVLLGIFPFSKWYPRSNDYSCCSS